MTHRLSDRIAGAIFLALALWYGLSASSYEVTFGDPLGPSGFPQLIAVPLGGFALFLIFRPDPDPVWIHRSAALRQVVTLAILLTYPFVLEPMGFPLATTLGAAFLGRVLGATWLQAAILGLAVGFGLFVIFDTLLGLPLPFAPRF